MNFKVPKRTGSDSRGLKRHYKMGGGVEHVYLNLNFSANFPIPVGFTCDFFVFKLCAVNGRIFGVLTPGVAKLN